MKTYQYIFVWIFTMVFVTGYAQQGTKNFIDQPYMEVTGEATLKITPDEIFMQIVLSELETNPRNNISVMERNLMQVLKVLDVDKEQLRMQDMSSNYQEQWIGKDQVKEVKAFELKLTSAKKASEVLHALRSKDIGLVKVTRVDHSRMDQLLLQVKTEAIKNAQTKGQTLAAALGQNIGQAIYIAEHRTYVPQMYRNQADNMRFAREASAKSALPDDLAFSELELKASILVRFKLMQ